MPVPCTQHRLIQFHANITSITVIKLRLIHHHDIQEAIAKQNLNMIWLFQNVKTSTSEICICNQHNLRITLFT